MFLFYYTAKIVVFFHFRHKYRNIFMQKCKYSNVQTHKNIYNKNIKAFLCGYIK